MLGTKSVCQAFSQADDNYNGYSISCSYFIELKAGDTVYCKLDRGIINEGKWSQFHGMRVN